MSQPAGGLPGRVGHQKEHRRGGTASWLEAETVASGSGVRDESGMIEFTDNFD